MSNLKVTCRRQAHGIAYGDPRTPLNNTAPQSRQSPPGGSTNGHETYPQNLSAGSRGSTAKGLGSFVQLPPYDTRVVCDHASRRPPMCWGIMHGDLRRAFLSRVPTRRAERHGPPGSRVNSYTRHGSWKQTIREAMSENPTDTACIKTKYAILFRSHLLTF
jgi:hypothetical protein